MASRWLETSSASTALGSRSWPDPDSDSDDSGKRSWSGSETSSLSRWVLTLNDSVRANDPDLRPTEALIDVEDPGARDPDVRGAAIDRVNRFAVPESIGTHYPDLPFGHSVFNKDLVPKDVIDRGAATSAYLNHMKRECKPCVLYPSREGCKKGINCRYCHFEHPTVELSHRIRKSMRDKIKCRLRRFTMLFRMKRQSILWLGFAFRPICEFVIKEGVLTRGPPKMVSLQIQGNRSSISCSTSDQFIEHLAKTQKP